MLKAATLYLWDTCTLCLYSDEKPNLNFYYFEFLYFIKPRKTTYILLHIHHDELKEETHVVAAVKSVPDGKKQ